MLIAMIPGISTFLYPICIMPLDVRMRPKTNVNKQRLQQVLHQHRQQVAAGHMPVALQAWRKTFSSSIS